MASLRERKTVWHIRYYDRSRDPKETTDAVDKEEYTRTEVESEARWRQELYDRGHYDPWTQEGPGRPARSGEMTIADAVSRYVEEKRDAGRRGAVGGWTERTYKSDAPVLKQFARHVGPGVQLRRLRLGHLRSWVYKEDLAEATRRSRWAKLTAMLRWFKEHGWMTELPTFPDRPQKRRRVRKTIGPGQLETICTAYEHLRSRKIEANKHTTTAGVEWHPDAWRLAFYQGLRRTELLELRVRNVFIEEEMIQIGDRDWQQKGKRESLIPLTDRAREVLEPYMEDRNPEERIFSTPPTNDRVSRQFREAVDHATGSHELSGEAGEERPFERLEEDPSEIDLYTLRHSCCTYWLRQRRRLIWVNHLMRHRDVETTMNYVHLLPTDLKEMYQMLGD